MNNTKTRIDTAYHGVPFLGKVSYPYGYQKPSKQVVKRVSQKAKKFNCTEENNLLAKVNSQIGNLKNYNCKKLIQNYESLLPQETKEKVKLDKTEYKFKKLEKNEEVYCTYVLNK